MALFRPATPLRVFCKQCIPDQTTQNAASDQGAHRLLKDCLPHLLHGSEINSLPLFCQTLCYTFVINRISFDKMHGFSINRQ